MTVRHLLYCSLLFILSVSVFAQYKKKVISFVDHTVAARSAGMDERMASYLAETFSNGVKMERFQYTTLPDAVVRNFIADADGLRSPSADEVRAAIERTLAPKFLELLDLNKEALSQQNLSEAERNSFLATKAQAAGLSAAELESILNSGFFFVPYVEYFSQDAERGHREEKNEAGKVIRRIPTITQTVRLKAGLLWFQLAVDKENRPSVRYIGTANGWTMGPIERSETRDLDNSTGLDWEVFEQAVGTSAVNAGNATKRLEEFKLSGSVTEVTTFGVKLDLGTREGLKLDDSYWIEELQETEAGDIVKSRRGFVKVREVGDNRNDGSALSYAQTITGTNYSPGLSLTEIPMIGINALGGIGTMPMSILPFDNRGTRFGLSKYDFALRLTNEITGSAGPFLWTQVNIANNAKVSELWFHLGGAISFQVPEGKFYFPAYSTSGGTSIAYTDSADIGFAYTIAVNLGLVKKFYFRRFGLVLQGDVKYAFTNFSATAHDNKFNDLDVSLTNGVLGLDGKAGLEVYLTPTLSIGGGAEYNVFGTDNIWTATVTDKDKNETKNSDAVGPDTQYKGLSIYLWINYALPSLF